MKKKSFGSRARKILLAFNCLILAILFWFAVKLVEIGEIPFISFIFS